MGLIQGLTLGILLLILNFKHFRNTYWLGIYLILISLRLLNFIPGGLGLDQYYPALFLLPLNFSWLLFAVFFIYTQKISIFSDQKIKYWLLIPGILSLFIQVILYLQPYEVRVEISQSSWYHYAFTFVGILFSWSVGFWNLRLLNRHKTEVENTFSELENKALKWVRIFLIYSLISSIFIHVLYFISPQNYYFKVIFSILDLVAIYWIAIHGVIQQNVLSTLTGKGAEQYTQYLSGLKEGVQEDQDNKQELEALMEKVDAYMKRSEIFLNRDLTIVELAEKLHLHPKKISTGINTVSNQNFNSYINALRIEKAKSILDGSGARNYSIEGIGQEVGFHSKSAFYAAFKKVTGTTPTRYKE